MGNISELLHITYGDNCLDLFNKHGFVWDWQMIGGKRIKDGCIVTAAGMLAGYNKIRNVAPLYGSKTIDKDEIAGYAILRAEVIDNIHQIKSGEQLVKTIEVLKSDDTITEVKARIQRYARTHPDITIKIDRVTYRLKLNMEGEPYFKMETSRTPRRNV